MNNYDITCLHIEFLFDDALYSPFGEHCCMLQKYFHGEYDQNLDYHPCTEKDYLECPIYLRFQEGGLEDEK